MCGVRTRDFIALLLIPREDRDYNRDYDRDDSSECVRGAADRGVGEEGEERRFSDQSSHLDLRAELNRRGG